MQSEEGRAFWKEKGFAFNAKFNLSTGSDSRKYFDAFLQEPRKK